MFSISGDSVANSTVVMVSYYAEFYMVDTDEQISQISGPGLTVVQLHNNNKCCCSEYQHGCISATGNDSCADIN